MNNIPQIKIALGGAPMVGKTTILNCFARRNQNSHFTVQVEEAKRTVQLDITLPQMNIRFMAVQGAFLTKNFFPELLTGTRVMLYIVSASVGSEQQQSIFEQYVSYAVSVGAHWNNIPWIFVLNKVDLGNKNPLLRYIPTQLRNDIIRCSATQGVGIEQLWQKILVVVS